MTPTATISASGRTREAGASRLLLPLLGVMAGLQTADPMISTVALVPASKALGFPAATEALAASISTLALAASVIPTGLIADRVGRRRVLLAALAVAAIGDLIAAVSPSAPAYLAGRAVAGIGLGAVFGASFALVARAAGQQLGSALGVFTAMGSITGRRELACRVLRGTRTVPGHPARRHCGRAPAGVSRPSAR